MRCPKCGLEQTESEECRGCGIIIARYLARQQAMPGVAAARGRKRRRYGLLGIERELRNYYLAMDRSLGAGMDAQQAHRSFIEHTSSLRDTSPYRHIEAALADGRPASEGMRASPDYFPAHHMRLVAAGEQSGDPSTMYRQLHELVSRRIETVGTVTRELRKPVLTLLASFFILPLPVLMSAGAGAYLSSSLLPLVGAGLVFMATAWCLRRVRHDAPLAPVQSRRCGRSNAEPPRRLCRATQNIGRCCRA